MDRLRGLFGRVFTRPEEAAQPPRGAAQPSRGAEQTTDAFESGAAAAVSSVPTRQTNRNKEIFENAVKALEWQVYNRGAPQSIVFSVSGDPFKISMATNKNDQRTFWLSPETPTKHPQQGNRYAGYVLNRDGSLTAPRAAELDPQLKSDGNLGVLLAGLVVGEQNFQAAAASAGREDPPSRLGRAARSLVSDFDVPAEITRDFLRRVTDELGKDESETKCFITAAENGAKFKINKSQEGDGKTAFWLTPQSYNPSRPPSDSPPGFRYAGYRIDTNTFNLVAPAGRTLDPMLTEEQEEGHFQALRGLLPS